MLLFFLLRVLNGVLKSNILSDIFAKKQVLNILLHAGFKRNETCFVTRH